MLGKTKDAHTLEPILAISEFELEAESVLGQAKKDAALLVQEAKEKAVQIMQKEKYSFSAIEKESLERTENELSIEKENINKKAGAEIEYIRNISEDKARQATDYILEKIIPR